MTTESPTQPLEPSDPTQRTSGPPEGLGGGPRYTKCLICNEQIIGQSLRLHRAAHNRLQSMTREQADRNSRWIAHIKDLLNGRA